MNVRRIWRSTFGLVAAVALGFVLVTVAIGIAAIQLTHEAFELQLDEHVATETSALRAEMTENGLPGLIETIRLREAARSTGGLLYLLVDASGTPLAGSMVPVSVPHAGYEEHFEFRFDGESGLAQAMGTEVPGGLLLVAADRKELFGIDRKLTRLFLAALAVMLVVGIGSAALIGLATQRRLGRIETTALAIMKGEFSQRIAVDGSDSEFDRLAIVLNGMLDRISALIENVRQVSSDVAHDLRTPLTRLYNSLESAALEPDPQAKLQRIEAARHQSAELLEIFSALLRISEIEAMAERLPRHALDLSLLVDQMAESYRPAMEDSGRTLRCEVQPGLTLDGDARLLNQAMANLLDNALRHTQAGAIVKLAAARDAEAIRICVSDNGPGVASAEVDRLFQRFARSERSRSTPGHGLGLSLVAAVAKAHGGSVAVSTRDGFQVVLSLPSVPSPRPGHGTS